MDINALLMEALNLMLIGMLFVGVFLSILVILIPLLNKIVPEEKIPAPAQLPAKSQTAEDDIIAVISAAVTHYRNNHKH